MNYLLTLKFYNLLWENGCDKWSRSTIECNMLEDYEIQVWWFDFSTINGKGSGCIKHNRISDMYI